MWPIIGMTGPVKERGIPVLRNIALILFPLALLAAACSSSGGSPDANSDSAQPPTSPTEPALAVEKDGAGAADLLASMNPFELLGSIGGPTSSEANPELKAALLTASDLPGEFMPFGEFGLAAPTELGPIDMAGSVFASGDLSDGDFEALVMSVVADLPPEALAELGDPSKRGALTEAQMSQFEDELGPLGEAFGNVELLDASGLGDGGVGIHFEMDFGTLLAGFGAPEGDLPFSSIVIDMYMFLRGERMLMVMLMAPDGEAFGLNARDLAELMDERAAAAF